MMTSLHFIPFIPTFFCLSLHFYFHPISPSSSHAGKSPSCDSLSSRSEIGGNDSTIRSDNSTGDGTSAISAVASETLKKQIIKASEIMTFQQKLLNLMTESMKKQDTLYKSFREKVHNLNFVPNFGCDEYLPKFSLKERGAPFGNVSRTTGKVRKRNYSSSGQNRTFISSIHSENNSNDELYGLGTGNSKSSEACASSRAELQIMSEMRTQMDMHRRLIEHRCDQLGPPPLSLGIGDWKIAPLSPPSSAFSSSSLLLDNNQKLSSASKSVSNNFPNTSAVESSEHWWDSGNDNNFEDNLFAFLETGSNMDSM